MNKPQLLAWMDEEIPPPVSASQRMFLQRDRDASVFLRADGAMTLVIVLHSTFGRPAGDYRRADIRRIAELIEEHLPTLRTLAGIDDAELQSESEHVSGEGWL